jgi:hypothetical protein
MSNLNPDQFRTVFHGVYDPEVLPKIREEGLQPKRLPEVYTSPDFHTATMFAKKHVLEVKLHPSEVLTDTPHSVTSGPIPPERIVKVHERPEGASGREWSDSINRDVPMPASMRAALGRFKQANPGVIPD